MKLKKLFSALTAAVCGLGLLTALPKQAPALEAKATETIHNPFIWSDVPDDDIIRVDDTYYMVHTTMYFTPGVPVMKSKDLFSWEICNYVYDTYANGDVQNLTNGKHDYAHGQGATSLRYHDGTFYVFFGSYGTNNSYVYMTKDIENGPWTCNTIRGMYHDASMLFDTDGKKYLVYGGGGEIKIKQFNDQMTDFTGGERTLFKTNLTGLAGEGSHVHKIGDYYYVFVIAWPNGKPRIELCYRSKSLTGQWEGKTVLQSGLGTYGSGVAQGGVIQTVDGDWYALLFQDHGAVGRIPVLVPFRWVDGWPVMGENGKAPINLEVPDGYTGTRLAKSDSFDYSSNELALEWQWNHNPDNSAWSVTDRPGYLRLKNARTAGSLLWARNTLTMRTEGPSCSGAVKLDASGMKPGDRAGLSAFQFHYGCVGVMVGDDGSKKVYFATNGGSEINNSSDKIGQTVNMQGDEVWLKVDYTFNTVDGNFNVSNNIDKANFFYSFDGANWTKIGDTLNMDYNLKLFTGYRNALYSYGTKSTGGYADFDEFVYDRADWNYAEPKIVEPDPNGYIFHYTFENGVNGFSGRGSASVSSVSTEAFEGSKSLACTGREATWNGAVHTLSASNCKPGQTYSFSTNVKFTEGADSETFHFTLQYTDSTGTVRYDKIATETVMKGEWVQLANTAYTIPAGATAMQIYIETEPDKLSFFVDDMICAEEGREIEGAGKSEFVLGDVNKNGKIDVADMTMLKQALLGKELTAAQKLAADVNRSTDLSISDLVWYVKFLTGQTNAYPEKEEPERKPSTFNYQSNLQYKEADNKRYFSQPANHGEVIKETYNGINGNKTMYVYVPYGYDKSKQYNVFYLMHGGGENEGTCFNDNAINIDIMLDNMIANGDIEPMIVVCPTFNGCPAPDNNMGAGTVWNEMRQSIIPYVESKYSTYAKSTSIEDLKASRYHRAYGGFSMGAGSTWNMFCNNLDICAYYMPLSGHCWLGANGIANAIDKSGFKQNEYFVLAATGTEDLAYGNMVPLINSLKSDTKHFTYTSDFSKGNFYFLEAKGNVHWWPQVRHYIYDALPYFFHEGQ